MPGAGGLRGGSGVCRRGRGLGEQEAAGVNLPVDVGAVHGDVEGHLVLRALEGDAGGAGVGAVVGLQDVDLADLEVGLGERRGTLGSVLPAGTGAEVSR